MKISLLCGNEDIPNEAQAVFLMVSLTPHPPSELTIADWLGATKVAEITSTDRSVPVLYHRLDVVQQLGHA